MDSSRGPIEAPPLIVKIATIQGPNTFWVTEIPCINEDEFQRSNLRKVLQHEKELAKKYNKNPAEGGVLGMLQEIREGMLVTVRLTSFSKHWFRARVLSVISTKTKDVRARLFLIDYGNYIDNISLRTCIRDLPRHMRMVGGLAFQVILAGLEPLSLDIDYDKGMKHLEQVVANEWNVSAFEKISEVVNNRSFQRMAELTCYQKDAIGRVHGVLSLFQRDQSDRKLLLLELNDWLTTNDYAIFNESRLSADLKLKPSRYIGPKTISICGHGADLLSTGNESFFSAAETHHDTEPEDCNISLAESDTSVKSRRVGTWLSVPPIPKEKKIQPLATEGIQGSGDRSEEVGDGEASTVWQSFRLDDSIVRERQKIKAIVVPAGIDPGKFLEAQLERVEYDGIGPKRIEATELYL